MRKQGQDSFWPKKVKLSVQPDICKQQIINAENEIVDLDETRNETEISKENNILSSKSIP